MDEPTTALDVIVQAQIVARLQALQREKQFAILFITHDLPLLLAISDHLIIMRDGLEAITHDDQVVTDCEK